MTNRPRVGSVESDFMAHAIPMHIEGAKYTDHTPSLFMPDFDVPSDKADDIVRGFVPDF